MDAEKTKHKRYKMQNWIFIVLGSLLVLDTILVFFVSNFNFGVIAPAILGLPLLLYGLFEPALAGWFETPAGHVIRFFVFFCYTAFLVLFIVCVVLIQSGAKKQPAPGADAIIVLGAGVRGEEPSLVLKKRLNTAAAYWRENQNAYIVVSGAQGPEEHISEAEAMYRYLRKLGIPEEKILKEENATSTYENFTYSKALLKEQGIEGRVVYVTTSFHVYRAGKAAKAAGVEAEGLAAPYSWYMAPNFYLREVAALVRYWLLGIV